MKLGIPKFWTINSAQSATFLINSPTSPTTTSPLLQLHYTSTTPLLQLYYTSATPLLLHLCHTSAASLLHLCYASTTPLLHTLALLGLLCSLTLFVSKWSTVKAVEFSISACCRIFQEMSLARPSMAMNLKL